MSEEGVKFCKDCKWCKKFWGGLHLSRCKHPDCIKDVPTAKYDYLTGGKPDLPFAVHMRNWGPCKERGVLFEERQRRWWFWS